MHDEDYGYCECGVCGQKTELAEQTIPSIGWVKGEPKRFIHGHQSRKPGPKYEVDADGCWLFLGYIDRKGYGQMRPHGSKRMHPAHRAFYVEKHGPIPEGMTLDHTCHTEDKNCPGGPTCKHRRCVNPDHLEPCSAIENAKRGRPPGPKVGYKKPKPTHCKHGHEFVGNNIIVGSDGGWRCRECQRRRMREAYYRRKAKAASLR